MKRRLLHAYLLEAVSPCTACLALLRCGDTACCYRAVLHVWLLVAAHADDVSLLYARLFAQARLLLDEASPTATMTASTTAACDVAELAADALLPLLLSDAAAFHSLGTGLIQAQANPTAQARMAATLQGLLMAPPTGQQQYNPNSQLYARGGFALPPPPPSENPNDPQARVPITDLSRASRRAFRDNLCA